MKKNKKTTGILAAILIVLVVIVAAIIIVFSVRGKKSTESTTETIDAAGKHHVEIQVKRLRYHQGGAGRRYRSDHCGKFSETCSERLL